MTVVVSDRVFELQDSQGASSNLLMSRRVALSSEGASCCEDGSAFSTKDFELVEYLGATGYSLLSARLVFELYRIQNHYCPR